MLAFYAAWNHQEILIHIYMMFVGFSLVIGLISAGMPDEEMVLRRGHGGIAFVWSVVSLCTALAFGYSHLKDVQHLDIMELDAAIKAHYWQRRRWYRRHHHHHHHHHHSYGHSRNSSISSSDHANFDDGVSLDMDQGGFEPQDEANSYELPSAPEEPTSQDNTQDD